MSEFKQKMASIMCKHINIINIGHIGWNKAKISIIGKKTHKNKNLWLNNVTIHKGSNLSKVVCSLAQMSCSKYNSSKLIIKILKN